jgi:hypothetical protein
VRLQSNRSPREGKRQRQIPWRKMLTLSDSNNFGPFSIQVKAKGSAWASSSRIAISREPANSFWYTPVMSRNRVDPGQATSR